MKIYTRTGDDGTTGLFGGGRVAKTHPRIDAYGTVDETNAVLGLARTRLGGELARAVELLDRLQHELFVLGGDLASPGETKYPVPRVTLEMVAALEADIDALEADLPPLKSFILPGGSEAGAALHLARTVARRAERATLDLAHDEPVPKPILRYLNRLSDLLFVLARWTNQHLGAEETPWKPIER